jgi:hypothetical protein
MIFPVTAEETFIKVRLEQRRLNIREEIARLHIKKQKEEEKLKHWRDYYAKEQQILQMEMNTLDAPEAIGELRRRYYEELRRSDPPIFMNSSDRHAEREKIIKIRLENQRLKFHQELLGVNMEKQEEEIKFKNLCSKYKMDETKLIDNLNQLNRKEAWEDERDKLTLEYDPKLVFVPRPGKPGKRR